MNGAFNGPILLDKLSKLNCTQQSIETLSHWCIFHRRHAKQVVEAWEQQFYRSPSEQRVAFLFLANDILQNSRRKGLEFINEFFSVLPGALSDVHKHGGEFGRNTVSRLIGIWEERKVFGSHVKVLKDEMLGRKSDNRPNEKAISYKLKQPGEVMEKVIASYQDICNHHMDEDALLKRCQVAICSVEKAQRELENDDKSGGANGPHVSAELHLQYAALRQCIEQLKVAESSRATLGSILREALNEQEIKVEQIKQQIQVAESLYQQTGIIFPHLKIGQIQSEQGLKESSMSPFSATSPPVLSSDSSTITGDRARLSPASDSQDGTTKDNNLAHTGEEHNKTAAAAMAARLTASSGSAHVLSYVLSSLAAEGVIGKTAKEEYQPDSKRPKLENNINSLPPPQLQPPSSPFPHPDLLQQPPPPPPMSPPSPPMEPPPPPTIPLTPPPPPPTTAQYTPNVPGHMLGMPYNFGVPVPLLNYPVVGMQPMYPGALNPYNNFQQPNGNNDHLFGQPPLPPSSAQPSLTQQ